MTIRRALLLLAVALTAAASVAPAVAAPVVPETLTAGPIRAQIETPPARLLVYAQEWSLWPSRSRLKPGRVIVQLWNRGEDAHDLRIRRLSRTGTMVGRTQGVGVTDSGQLRQATWHLSPGRYELYCSMPGHMRMGMHARITVS